MFPVDELNSYGIKAMWCSEGTIGDEIVKKLLVQNELMYTTKKQNNSKKSEKELEAVNSLLKKSVLNLCKCRADAEQSVSKIIAKLQLVKLSDEGVCYKKVKKYTHKGRQGKDEEKVTVSVKVYAQVQLDDTASEQKIKADTYYVSCTNYLYRK